MDRIARTRKRALIRTSTVYTMHGHNYYIHKTLLNQLPPNVNEGAAAVNGIMLQSPMCTKRRNQRRAMCLTITHHTHTIVHTQSVWRRLSGARLKSHRMRALEHTTVLPTTAHTHAQIDPLYHVLYKYLRASGACV